MKLTEDLIKKLEVALDIRKKDGTPIWNDGDEIDDIVERVKDDILPYISNNLPGI
jgi:hypothetical protein